MRAGGAPATVNAAGWLQVVAESPGRVKRDASVKGRPAAQLIHALPHAETYGLDGPFAFAETQARPRRVAPSWSPSSRQVLGIPGLTYRYL